MVWGVVMLGVMTASDSLADDVQGACAEAVKAATVWHRVGETFRGPIVDVTANGALVQISDPTILALAVSQCVAGVEVTVRLIEVEVEVEVEVAKRSVLFDG